LDITQISGHLATILQQETVEFEQTALVEIAQAADGSMRDALSLLDQAISYGAGTVNSEQVNQMLGTISQQQCHVLVKALLNNDGQDVLQQSDELAAQGRDFKAVLNELLAILQRIATIQLVPDLENSDDTDFQQLQLLSQQASAETIQLLYQIALHGKRDLPYAADPKSGFDMTLLRMLSFQPKQVDTRNDITPPISRTQDNTSQTTAIDNPPTATEQKTQYSEPELVKIIEPPQIAEPRLTVPVEISSVNNDPNIKLNASSWLEIIASLKLTAFARQLADNSSFIKFEADKVSLFISPELAHLASEKAQDRLESALGKYLALTIKLVFEQDDQLQSNPTLAGEQVQQAKISQQQAADSIHNDPAVDAIKHAFNARIIESTIKPIA
ncbi:MAG: DNA polymerase III subunit gamma/tau, partial [Gammaproteobacteria bacterium]